MNYKELKKAPRCHYLLVWEQGRQIILNCSERVGQNDIVLSLMTKEQYYEFERDFRKASSIYEVSMSIDSYWAWKKKHRREDEPLSCDYDTIDEYLKDWQKVQDDFHEVFKKNFPNLCVEI